MSAAYDRFWHKRDVPDVQQRRRVTEVKRI
jgi:hypothetical protein